MVNYKYFYIEIKKRAGQTLIKIPLILGIHCEGVKCHFNQVMVNYKYYYIEQSSADPYKEPSNPGSSLSEKAQNDVTIEGMVNYIII